MEPLRTSEGTQKHSDRKLSRIFGTEVTSDCSPTGVFPLLISEVTFPLASAVLRPMTFTKEDAALRQMGIPEFHQERLPSVLIAAVSGNPHPRCEQVPQMCPGSSFASLFRGFFSPGLSCTKQNESVATNSIRNLENFPNKTTGTDLGSCLTFHKAEAQNHLAA